MASDITRLPQSYRDWLNGLESARTVEFDDREWKLDDIDQLQSPVTIDGRTAPRIGRLKLYADTFEEVTGETETVTDEGEPFPLTRVRQGLAIGDDNGDPLYIDPDDGNSVWVYHHDGGDVERLAESVEEWIAGTKPVTD